MPKVGLLASHIFKHRNTLSTCITLRQKSMPGLTQERENMLILILIDCV